MFSNILADCLVIWGVEPYDLSASRSTCGSWSGLMCSDIVLDGLGKATSSERCFVHGLGFVEFLLVARQLGNTVLDHLGEFFFNGSRVI